MSAPTDAAVVSVLERLLDSFPHDPIDIRTLPQVGAFNAAFVLVQHECYSYLDRHWPDWQDAGVGSVNYLIFFCGLGTLHVPVGAALDGLKARLKEHP